MNPVSEQPVSNALNEPSNAGPAVVLKPPSLPPAASPGVFRGRIGRLGYLAGLLYFAVAFVAIIIFFAIAGRLTSPGSVANAGVNTLVFLVGAVLVVAMVVLGVGINIRRWHDLDQSGWFTLLHLIPGASLVIVFIMLIVPGTSGPNKYGQPFSGADQPARVFGFK